MFIQFRADFAHSFVAIDYLAGKHRLYACQTNMEILLHWGCTVCLGRGMMTLNFNSWTCWGSSLYSTAPVLLTCTALVNLREFHAFPNTA